MTVRTRVRVPEVMDGPGLDPVEHRRALDGLGRVDAVSRGTATLWKSVRDVAAGLGGRPVRVLDLACGGGPLAVGLARRAHDAGLPIEVRGCDRSPVALDHARTLAARQGVPAVEFHELDVIRDPLPSGFDVICTSLFLHHLSDAEAVSLLERMASAARHAVLVSDLRRTPLGHFLAWAGCRLLSRSPVVHVDGTRSVRAAFTTEEAQVLAARAGLSDAKLSEHWPQRFVLIWRRTGAR